MTSKKIKKYRLYIIILLFAIGLLEVIKSNIFIILLFLQSAASIGNLDLNGLQIKRPSEYLLKSSYSVINGSHYYGFLPTDKLDNSGVGIQEKRSYKSTHLDDVEIDFYFLVKDGEQSKLLMNKNISNNNYYEMWKCGNKVFKAKVLPETFTNEHTTLFLENESVFILIKGDLAELKHFKGCI